MISPFTRTLFAFLLLLPVVGTSQTYTRGADRISSWLPLQAIPNFLYYADSDRSSLALDWEFTPVLFSFGMNDQISPWYSFIVEPTARFVGSLELNVAAQMYTSKVGSSHVGVSAHVMGHIPILEMGEHLVLNVGVGSYQHSGQARLFKVVGVGTAFGMLHLNVKHADRPTTWITALEARIF